MPWRKVPINQELYTSIDDVSLVNRTPTRNNTYRNAAGDTVVRPGYAEYLDTGVSASVDGFYWWYQQNILIVVSNTNVYKKETGGSLTTLGTGLFESGARPTFANFGDTLYAANGGDIIKITTATASALTDANIPAGVTHVAAFDQYLLANKSGTGQVHFSDVLLPEAWSGNYFTAEQSPDDVYAVYPRWSEIWVFGQETIELWYNDGDTPFVPYGTGVISTGCIAPDTIQWIRGGFYWLNQKREVVRSSGQSYEIISDPIKNLLRADEEITDAVADYVTVANEELYILTLPSFGDKGLTLVYDLKKNEWMGEWNYFNTATLNFERFRGQCYQYIPDLNLHLWGDYNNGKIYQMSHDYYQDDGATLKARWLTGNFDHGTFLQKRSYKLRVKMLRGQGAEGSDPVLMVRWQDNGNQVWSNTKYIDLNEIGETEFFVSLRRLGMYRSRQYEFSVTDPTYVVMAGAEEYIEGVNQ